MTESKIITINFTINQIKNLDWLAVSQGITVAQAIRRALGTEVYLKKAVEERNATIFIQDDDGIKTLVFPSDM